jgi:hypothetical protein
MINRNTVGLDAVATRQRDSVGHAPSKAVDRLDFNPGRIRQAQILDHAANLRCSKTLLWIAAGWGFSPWRGGSPW